MCAVFVFFQEKALSQTLASKNQKPLSQYVLEILQTEQGLPSNTVSAILQTSNGYIYIGSDEGLSRFDGRQFVTVADIKSPVNKLYQDKSGALWIATNGDGLLVLRGDSLTAFTTEDGLFDNSINDIFEDGNHAVWIGTRQGLNVMQEGKFQKLPTEPSLIGQRISSIASVSPDSLWVGTERSGLFLILNYSNENLSIKHFTTSNGLVDNAITELHFDGSKMLWVGCANGLCRLINAQFERVGRDALQDEANIRTLASSPDGNLWIGTNKGVFRYDGEFFSRLTTAEGMTTNNVLHLTVDREKNIWVGTNRGGLHRLFNGNLSAFTAKEGVFGEQTYAIFEDADGAVWIGGYGGLSKIQNGKTQTFNRKNGVATDFIRSISQDLNGAIWVGTFGEGLFIYDKGKFTRYTAKNGLFSDLVQAVHLDTIHKTMWIGTRKGLNFFENGNITGFAIREINSLYTDRIGNVWICTDESGVIQFNGDEFIPHTLKDGLNSNVTFCAYQTSDSILWIGTAKGLCAYYNGKFHSLNEKSSILSQSIFQIVGDDLDALWFGVSSGIVRVPFSDLKRLLVGESRDLNYSRFGKSDGMKSSVCTVGGTAIRTRNGNLWFPTTNGAVMVNPKNLNVNTVAPPVFIEQLRIDDSVYPPSESVVLNASTNRIEFQYSAPTFVSSSKVKFQYRLEGFEEQWIDAGARHSVSYTNLPPRTYKFRVRAMNGDGVLSQNEATVVVEQLPKVYQTYWFYGLCVASLIFLGFTITSWRVRQIEKREAKLQQLVAERTESLKLEKERAEMALRSAEEANAFKTELLGIAAHDLKNPLQSILGFAELIKEYAPKNETTYRMAETIERSSMRMLKLIIELLQTAANLGKIELELKPTNIGDLARLVVENNIGQARRKDQRIQLTVKENLFAKIDGNRIRDVFENLVSNAVKYSPLGKQIWVTVYRYEPQLPPFQDTFVRFEVRDEGQGLSEEDLSKLFRKYQRLSATPTGGESSTGLGLSIVKQIVEQQDGKVWAESEGKNKGATFIVEFLECVLTQNAPARFDS